jgi:hypothetical protein
MINYILAAASAFPLAAGTYRGEARCTDPAGAETVYQQKLELNGSTMTTTILSAQGDEVFVKTAKFASNGRFTWSGPEVKSGEGYCTASGVCHWDLTVNVAGAGSFTGEDTLVQLGDKLVIAGSVVVMGQKYVCEEAYKAVE